MTKTRPDLLQSRQPNDQVSFKKKSIKSGKLQRTVLFDKRKLRPHWTLSRQIGPGLVNGQNTCFLNSVLQCLTYTPPLAQYLLDGTHRKECTVQGYCALCSMETHVGRCFKGHKSTKSGAAILPRYFTSNLRALSPTLRLREQEDAHEFLMFLLAAIQKSSLHGLGKVDPKVEETTLLHQIFGGRVQSQLWCQSCKAISNTYEPFLDLSVDLHRANTLEKALKNFIKVDIIGGNDPDNRYKCDSCKQKVTAGKQMTICHLPTNLTIHLKRFTFDLKYGSMRKIMNDVKYPECLDMAPYISKEKKIHSSQLRYRLYAVLVHLGHGCGSGHYYAYVKNSSGKWYRMDDEDVVAVSAGEVFSQQAYMLFYEQEPSKKSDSVNVGRSTEDEQHVNPKTVEIQGQQKLQKKEKDIPIPKADHFVEGAAKKRKARDESDDIEESQTRSKMESAEIENLKSSTALPKQRANTEITALHITAIRPQDWVVRPVDKAFRSLRGELSPPTFAAAMGDESAWIIRPEGEKTDSKSQEKVSKRRKRAMVWDVSDA
ncbi:Ubiquitin carboxyl-terminal hydrolase 36 [Apophysomyces sp. BC1015]|nr:Ubiquitin carboxyl-terminal hydrolase 36 [Apophysomyces sp. BC1015]